MTLAMKKPKLTPEEYLDAERQAETRSEFYGGEVFAMSGASPGHSVIAVNLYTELNMQLRARPCTVYSADTRVLVAPVGLYTYPDASIVCGDSAFDKYDNLLNPILLVEILSPTTEAYDRGKKFDMYRMLESLQQYLLIAQDVRRAYLFTRQPDSTWLMQVSEGVEGRVELASIACNLPLDELYRKVGLERCE